MLMTMEGWQDTVEEVNSPYSKLVFIPFMLFASYIFLNLVVGIIVTAMEDIVEKEKEADSDEIKNLSEKVDKIYLMLENRVRNNQARQGSNIILQIVFT